MNKPPLNIWNDIERCWVMRLDIVFEGQTISGIHNSDFEDVVNDIDWLIIKLSRYRDEMASEYGEPALKFPPKNFTHIYLMHDSSNGLTKIGRSVYPEKREKTLVSDRSSIELRFVSPLCDRKIEKDFHHRFRSKRERGEWFRLNAGDIQSIVNYKYGA